MMKLLTKLLFVAGLLLTVTAHAGPPGITVENAWIREAPPGAPMLAGYVTLKNNGSVTRALLGAESHDFGMIELHRSVFEDGVARMVQQERIEIPAGGSVTLEPGGLHLMLMKPQGQLRAGDTSGFTLRFDDGSSLEVEFAVRREAMGGMQHDHDHDHGHTQHSH